MRKSLMFILFLLFSTSHAMLITYQTVKGSAYPGEQTIYKVYIKNNENVSKRVYILRTSLWPSSVEPSYILDLGPYENETVTVRFSVPSDANRGGVLHQIEVRWDSESMLIPIISMVEIPAYGKVFISDLKVSPSVDPREGVHYNLSVTNNYGDLTIEVNVSVFDEFMVSSESFNLSLEKGVNEISDKLLIPRFTRPGNYTFKAALLYHGLLSEREENFSVIGYAELVKSVKEEYNLLGKSYVIVVENRGTVSGSTSISEELSPMDRYLMLSTNGKREGNNITWEAELGPWETKSFYYYVTFLPFWFVLFFIFLLLFVLYRMLQRVEVDKEVVEYSISEQGINMKIQVKVKNVWKGSVKDVKIYDPLPNISCKVLGYGVVEGTVVKRKGKNYVHWTIEEIRQGEEVILFYHLRINVGIIGKLVIEPTEVEYVSAGRQFLKKSNLLILKSE